MKRVGEQDSASAPAIPHATPVPTGNSFDTHIVGGTLIAVMVNALRSGSVPLLLNVELMVMKQNDWLLC